MQTPVLDTPAGETHGFVHLTAAGVSLVLDCRGPGLPTVLHWGAQLGVLDGQALENLALSARLPRVPNGMDEPTRVAVLPEHSAGWLGTPGLSGRRIGGRDWSPSFRITDLSTTDDGGGRAGVSMAAEDSAAHLALRLTVEMLPSGLVRMRASVRNTHPDETYDVDGLLVGLPVPPEASELLDLAGRWARERVPQRQPFPVGVRVRDNRRGRTGADATLLLVAGTPGFAFRTGQAWGLHVAWSGNHRTLAERFPTGEALLAGGELLLPGEVTLAPGEAYEAPTVYASYGVGLDEISARFHRYLRARPHHPGAARPRPVVMNTWEAVYFDHDLDRLRELADAGADVGAERFVLDDGWFRHRRDDTAGLGDWYVDSDVWPKGLHPLIEHVRGLGMEFGLWVEPEMVNPDSDLARGHPEWILATGGRLPPESRFQQVLNLGNPDAFAYIFERLNALLSEYPISYLKWDHNRDLIDAGQSPDGRPGVHAQTLAVYRLMDQLRAIHPGLEIESCSSGGARVDLGILERTDRVWASDCIDAHERQSIQRWTELLLPPELIGSHVGAPRSHTTGRVHDLSFRAATALFGHFGIEWDLLAATPDERRELARWVALYKRTRGLLHTGTVVRADRPDTGLWAHGVVAADASEAIFALVSIQTSPYSLADRVKLPGLAPDAAYRIELLPPGDVTVGPDQVPVPWIAAGGLTVTGRVLAEVGLQAPSLYPDHAALLRLVRQ